MSLLKSVFCSIEAFMSDWNFKLSWAYFYSLGACSRFLSKMISKVERTQTIIYTGSRRAVGNMSDCRSRGREFDPGKVPYFMENDHEIIATAILLPSADSRRVVSYKQKYVHEVLVNRLVQLAQEKVRLGELIIPTWP